MYELPAHLDTSPGTNLLCSAISTSIQNASDFTDLCAMYGYTAEEHVLQTKDGYLLGVHRLAWRKGEEDMKVNDGPASIKKPVVYLHHGLLMNSEVWVCLTDAERCLPFVLVDRGYDVWVCSISYVFLLKRKSVLMCISWETIAETSIPRSLSTVRPPLLRSGIFRLTSSLFTISRILSTMYWNRQGSRPCPTLVSLRGRHKPSLPCQYILG